MKPSGQRRAPSLPHRSMPRCPCSRRPPRNRFSRLATVSRSSLLRRETTTRARACSDVMKGMARLAGRRSSVRCSSAHSRERREDDPSRCSRPGFFDRHRGAVSRLRMEQICCDWIPVHCRVTSASEQAGASEQPLIRDSAGAGATADPAIYWPQSWDPCDRSTAGACG